MTKIKDPEELAEGKLPANLIQDLTLAKTFNDARSAAQLLIDSGTLPSEINTPEKVLTLTKYGRELGIGDMMALNSLHIIKGKITMSYQLIGSLLKRHNYNWTIVKDFEPIVDSAGNLTDNIETIIDFTWIPQKYIDLAEKFDKKDLLQVFTHRERRTWKEFEKAGFIRNKWETLPKLMMRIRTFTFGARFIAPEALQNVYETSEMADSMGQDYMVDSNGNILDTYESNGGVELDNIIIDK